jgi:hypothetical protein
MLTTWRRRQRVAVGASAAEREEGRMVRWAERGARRHQRRRKRRVGRRGEMGGTCQRLRLACLARLCACAFYEMRSYRRLEFSGFWGGATFAALGVLLTVGMVGLRVIMVNMGNTVNMGNMVSTVQVHRTARRRRRR